MSKLTKKGAQAVTADLDRLANLFQAEHETLGIPAKIARDFAYRLDLISDAVEKKAGLNRTALTGDDVYREPGFNPEEIGIEKSGPLEMIDSDEPWMNGEFTQQENRELREDVQSGDLANDRTIDEPQSPTPGKQASFEALGRQTAAMRLDAAASSLNKAASRSRHGAGLTRLAAQVLAVKASLMEGKAAPDHVSRTLQAIQTLLPHVAADESESEASSEETEKVAKLVRLASRVASGAKAPSRRQAAVHGYKLDS